MREILISQNEKEQKLLKLLQKYFKGQADSFLYKMLRKKNILLNGKKADGKEILQLGDTVQLYFSEESLGKLIQERESGEKELWTQKWQSFILYEDKHCILFNKPVGLLSENDGSSSFSVNSLLRLIIWYLFIAIKSYGRLQFFSFISQLCKSSARLINSLFFVLS